MNPGHLSYLRCPSCQSKFKLSQVSKETEGKIEEGELSCLSCSEKFSITRFIPRFVSQNNYAAGFGFQWNLHAKTQLDSCNGSTVSEERFRKETKWKNDLSGEIILEAGSGSGRFTEHIVKTNAMVISFDYSHAVDANYTQNGKNSNLLIVQADIYKMPFEKKFFDKVLCIGVLQHTPDPKKSFLSLCQMMKPKGEICVDIYRRTVGTLSKYWVRPFFKKMEHKKLYSFVDKYVDFMWPISTINSLLFKRAGNVINRFLLVPDYRPILTLSNQEMYKTWAKLDLFDALSPAYDNPENIKSFRLWFEEANLQNIDVHHGYNGIEGRAQGPLL